MCPNILPQHLVVSEGICAMLGLVLLDENRELPGKTAVWAALAHIDRQVLLHDRVLSAASDDGESMCGRPKSHAEVTYFLALLHINVLCNYKMINGVYFFYSVNTGSTAVQNSFRTIRNCNQRR